MSSASSPRTSLHDELLPSQHHRDSEKEHASAHLDAPAKRHSLLQIALRTFSNLISFLLCSLLAINLLLVYRTSPRIDRPHHLRRSYGTDRAYMSVDPASDSLWNQMNVGMGKVLIPDGDGRHNEGFGIIGM